MASRVPTSPEITRTSPSRSPAIPTTSETSMATSQCLTPPTTSTDPEERPAPREQPTQATPEVDDGYTLVQTKKKKSVRQAQEDDTVQGNSRPQAVRNNGAQGNSRPQPVTRDVPTLTINTLRHPPSPFNAFRIPAQEGFPTSYDVIIAMEEETPALKIGILPGRDESTVILPKDQLTYDFLTTLTTVSGKPVKILQLDPSSKTAKGVLMGYPVRLPLTPILRHHQVEEATRCTNSHTKEETRQVLVTLRGPLTASLDLGNWGTFYLRPYTPEPLRCFRCQRYGHHQASCKRPLTCGICSGNHDTRECLDKFKAKQEVHTKCPNCSKSHHAWNRSCPERKTRVQKGRESQVSWVREQQVQAPAPAGTFVWGQQRRTPAVTAPLLTEFPPLPSHTQPAPPKPQAPAPEPAPAIPQAAALEPASLIPQASASEPASPIPQTTPEPDSPKPQRNETGHTPQTTELKFSTTSLKAFSRKLASAVVEVIATALGIDLNIQALAPAIDLIVENMTQS